jgi:hypothetical protein
VRFTNANITHAEPSSQEYRMDLAAPEMVRVAKEAYTYQYELQLKKERDARLVEVREARNRARQDVARMLEEKETEAQRVRLEIETRGRAALTEAENEATALRHLGQAHRDNRAVIQYELARRRIEVG